MILKDFLSGSIDKTLSSVKDVITTFVQDKALQQKLNDEIDKRAHELKLRQLDFDEEAMKTEAADRANAREMYKESIKNDDVFVRRFPMILAASILGISGLILVALIFFKIPDTNRDILNISLGTLIGGGVVAVINFYFGSSYERKHKE